MYNFFFFDYSVGANLTNRNVGKQTPFKIQKDFRNVLEYSAINILHNNSNKTAIVINNFSKPQIYVI